MLDRRRVSQQLRILGDADALTALRRDEQLWRTFLDWEEAMCREPGALDGGTHILFAAEKT